MPEHIPGGCDKVHQLELTHVRVVEPLVVQVKEIHEIITGFQRTKEWIISMGWKLLTGALLSSLIVVLFGSAPGRVEAGLLVVRKWALGW